MLPKVSLLISCYNHEKYVEQTINDAVNQTYSNLEIIVIDDASTFKCKRKVHRNCQF